ncbi:MAG TPA: pyridoxal phosphate-dependent aminotransferase [Candidatus Acidoferrales bacterium]|nr:pyridoxal phosphate-dependent aminotransferase [Candidatus Acidoferrales bacterium]
MRFAQRLGRITTAASFDMLARGRALEARGRSIVHLGIGEPDFDTPAFIRDAAKRALDEGWTHYGPAPGLPEFRASIAASWRERRAIPCEARHVVVTPGAKPVLFFAMLALLEAGDEVIIPSPAFPNYGSIAQLADARVVPTPLRADRGFDLDLDALRARINARTRVLVLNSPHNPTGAVLPDATLHALRELVLEHDLAVIADDIYGDMVYEGRYTAFASLPGMFERTVTVDGFSKTWAMTGWRLGFGIMEEALARHMAALMNNSNSCTATFVQKAGDAALHGPRDEVVAMIAEFRVRRDLVVEALNAIPGVRCGRPAGAFYVFPRIERPGLTAEQLADRLLDEAGVVTLPGTAFGAEGEGYLRLSYANSVENLREGVRRIGQFLATA